MSAGQGKAPLNARRPTLIGFFRRSTLSTGLDTVPDKSCDVRELVGFFVEYLTLTSNQTKNRVFSP